MQHQLTGFYTRATLTLNGLNFPSCILFANEISQCSWNPLLPTLTIEFCYITRSPQLFQKILFSSLLFSGGTKWKHCPEMGQYTKSLKTLWNKILVNKRFQENQIPNWIYLHSKKCKGIRSGEISRDRLYSTCTGVCTIYTHIRVRIRV